jgi:hypothetical protein
MRVYAGRPLVTLLSELAGKPLVGQDLTFASRSIRNAEVGSSILPPSTNKRFEVNDLGDVASQSSEAIAVSGLQ